MNSGDAALFIVRDELASIYDMSEHARSSGPKTAPEIGGETFTEISILQETGMTPIAFTEMNIKRAPPTSGIYALYRDGEVIYYGHASGGKTTIQSRLKDHIAGRDSPCTRGAMTFTWEACLDSEARTTALLASFEQIHNSVPRCNVRR